MPEQPRRVDLAAARELGLSARRQRHADLVAADLISQAEHDVIAASVLVTDSIELAEAVELELEKQASKTKHSERIQHALNGRQSGIILVRDMQQGLDVINDARSCF